ncbi:MAG TPA: hypothetical protein DD657_03480 [Culturomica sp.]|nr:hypothetical protein [Culturomica sp.]
MIYDLRFTIYDLRFTILDGTCRFQITHWDGLICVISDADPVHCQSFRFFMFQSEEVLMGN